MNRRLFQVYNSMCESAFNAGTSTRKMLKTPIIYYECLQHLAMNYFPRLAYEQKFEREYLSWQVKHGQKIVIGIVLVTMLRLMNLKSPKQRYQEHRMIHVHQLSKPPQSQARKEK